jgi:hypothetical protein
MVALIVIFLFLLVLILISSPLFVGFIVLIAAFLACLEIQIEGPIGWAESLPCWFRKRNGLIVKIMGGRALTSYHFFLVLFILAIAHFPLVFLPWSWRLEFLIIGFILAILMIEDFLWFVFNPAYGTKKFRPGMIPWHKHWFGPVPDFFLYYGIVSLILIYFGGIA